jgi:superfamily I DNA/RNA helicase|uniref:3'-5' exonuclease n=1 Tax=Mesosutterella multiformis TaxID=2259133 RepID=UPI004027AB77
MNETIQPTLALSDTFFDSFGRAPRPLQKKLLAFISKFRQNPSSSGLNYEKIQDSASPGYRSARLDNDYRVIINQPSNGNVYLILWAGKHDEAYKWAKTHACRINPTTGSMQLYEVPVVATAQEPPAAVPGASEPAGAVPGAQKNHPCAPLFAQYSDSDLLGIGVPQECLPLVRSVTDRKELEAKRANLPAESFESLVWLADGESLEEVKSAYGEPEATEDPAQALKSAASQRSFKVIETDEEMMSVVNASLERWRVFLHPAQKRLVERESTGPMLVRGAAGTGKTVVAMHRAVNLIRRPDWHPGQKLLFTTYTKNLAIDISDQLDFLCTPDEKRRIEVVNLDAWLSSFLKQNRVTRQIAYPGNPDYDECWSAAINLTDPALGLPDSFYKEEWQRVVLPNEVETEQEYLKVSRKGRGTALSRKQRKAVWPVFEEMRSQLGNAGRMTVEDACFMALHILNQEKGITRYQQVIVDEAQDFGSEALKLLARLALPEGDDTKEPRILLAGDGQQRIYARQGSLASCGIRVPGRRSERLKLTYRTTEEIREAADEVLKGAEFDDLEGVPESRAGDLSNRHGSSPETFAADSIEEECRWIEGEIKAVKDELSLENKDICIVARTSKLLTRYQSLLEAAGYKTSRLSRTAPDNAQKDCLRLATMHRVKGLEFRAVFIVGASVGQIPFGGYQTEDKEEAAVNDRTERSLFYVAASRAKDALFVSCNGEPGAFLRTLMKKQQ